MLAEIDPDKVAPEGPTVARVSAADDLRDVASATAPAQLRALVLALSQDLARDDRPRAIELVGAINCLIEPAGLSLETEQNLELPGDPAAIARDSDIVRSST